MAELHVEFYMNRKLFLANRKLDWENRKVYAVNRKLCGDFGPVHGESQIVSVKSQIE